MKPRTHRLAKSNKRTTPTLSGTSHGPCRFSTRQRKHGRKATVTPAVTASRVVCHHHFSVSDARRTPGSVREVRLSEDANVISIDYQHNKNLPVRAHTKHTQQSILIVSRGGSQLLLLAIWPVYRLFDSSGLSSRQRFEGAQGTHSVARPFIPTGLVHSP